MSKTAKTLLGATMASMLMVFSLNVAFAEPPMKVGDSADAVDSTAKESKADKMIDHLRQELQLSDEQSVKMQAIVDANRAEMDRLRTEMEALREKMHAEMDKILTEEQKVKFEAMKADKKAKMKEMKGEKDGMGMSQGQPQPQSQTGNGGRNNY